MLRLFLKYILCLYFMLPLFIKYMNKISFHVKNMFHPLFYKKKMRHDLRYDVTLANEWRWVMNLFDYRLTHIGNFLFILILLYRLKL